MNPDITARLYYTKEDGVILTASLEILTLIFEEIKDFTEEKGIYEDKPPSFLSMDIKSILKKLLGVNEPEEGYRDRHIDLDCIYKEYANTSGFLFSEESDGGIVRIFEPGDVSSSEFNKDLNEDKIIVLHEGVGKDGDMIITGRVLFFGTENGLKRFTLYILDLIETGSLKNQVDFRNLGLLSKNSLNFVIRVNDL